MRYMNDLNSDTLSVVSIDSSYQYRIRPGDVLQVRVESSTDAKMELFKSFSGGQNNQMGASLLNGSLVDEYGNIELPMVGTIKVSGLTVKEAELEVKSKVLEYFQFVTVTVKFISFRVSVLGEVSSPGVKAIERMQASVFDVLAYSGDMTELANRKKVRLIRKEKGRNKVYTLDLSSIQMLASEHYYVRPGDVIYVEPLRYKVFRINSSLITLGSSLIALSFSLYAIFTRR